MKTDNYLSLCLEQAVKSPLHYRHGCIVLRGGKVIGQGFNDYRPGYDGGSLKHGRVAKSPFDGAAITELKEKLKRQKDKPKEKQQQSPPQQRQKGQTFVPFEGTGGGHGANTPLSMHSEMMAIHSALSQSSTLSTTTTSSKKPCFKLPSGDKRKARLRRETLAAYVNAVCETLQRSGQPQANNNNNVQQQDAQQGWDDEDRDQRRQDEERRLKETGRAFHPERSGEKHRKNRNQNGKRKGKKGQYEYQYGRYGQQTQQHSERRPSVSKQQYGHGIRGYDLKSKNDMSNGREAVPASLQHDKHKKDYKRSGKMKKTSHVEPPQPEPLLLPKGQTFSTSRSVIDREKHPRLNGADIYVARLGWCRDSEELRATASNLPSLPSEQPLSVPNSRASSVDDDSDSGVPASQSPLAPCGSLHDELINRRLSPTRTKTRPPSSNISTVRASRPCYRCITYMHSVGIKRVFWTNDGGEWEGGKVRDLVDALDHSMENVAIKDGPGGLGGPTGNGVFVTKHEVLMLKRMMGRKEGMM